MMKLLVLTLAVLAFVFSMPAERGKRDEQECCYRFGTCYSVNVTWRMGCNNYTCIRISTELISRPITNQCYDGRICRPLDSTWTDRCYTYQCNRGPYVRPLSMQCRDNDRCRPVNSNWTVGCITYQCIRTPIWVTIQPISIKCIDENGVCQVYPWRTGNSYNNCSCSVNGTSGTC